MILILEVCLIMTTMMIIYLYHFTIYLYSHNTNKPSTTYYPYFLLENTSRLASPEVLYVHGWYKRPIKVAILVSGQCAAPILISKNKSTREIMQNHWLLAGSSCCMVLAYIGYLSSNQIYWGLKAAESRQTFIPPTDWTPIQHRHIS